MVGEQTRTRERPAMLQVAGEGGGYRIIGQSTPTGWTYLVERKDQTLDESHLREPEQWLNSIEEALRSLNPNWPRLHPLVLHPAVKTLVLAQVRKFRPQLPADHLARWEHAEAFPED